MNKAKSEQPPEPPIVLSVSVIADGKFYPAGSETPFTEESLPPHLREYLATGDEDFFHPREIDFYNNPQARPDPGFTFQGISSGQWVSRQARQVAGGMEQQAWAEAEAEAANKLPPETEEALQDAHDKASALAKAQIQFNRDAVDAVYEAAAQAAEPPQLFVKRGGEMGRVERSKLKPGEPVFAKFDEGDWQVVGYVDVTGQAPPPPLIP